MKIKYLHATSISARICKVYFPENLGLACELKLQDFWYHLQDQDNGNSGLASTPLSLSQSPKVKF